MKVLGVSAAYKRQLTSEKDRKIANLRSWLESRGWTLMPAGYHQKQVVDKQWRAIFGKFNLKLQRLAHSGNWVNMHSSRYEDVRDDGRTLVFENDMASGGVAAHDVESVNVA